MNQHPRDKAFVFRTVLFCLVGAWLAASCSSGHISGSPTPHGTQGSTTILGSTTTAAVVDLTGELLSASDLPTGWAETPVPADQAKTCNTQPFDPAKPTGKARRYFRKNGYVPELEEELATFADAHAAFATVKARLDACRSFDATSRGQTVHESEGPMSFPQVGEESAAWTATFTLQGVGIVGDIVVARRGNQLVGIAMVDIGSVDTDQLQQFVTAALQRMPA